MVNFKIYELLFNIDFWSALFGFIGAVLMFSFGLRPSVDPEGHQYLVTGARNEKEIKKGKLYKMLGYVGICLLAISFLLQLIKNIIS